MTDADLKLHATSANCTSAPRVSIAELNMRKSQTLAEELRRLNPSYLQLRTLPDGTVAALQKLLLTRAIVLGCHRDGWVRRFCFDDCALADKRFGELQSEDDVPEGHVASRNGLPRP